MLQEHNKLKTDILIGLDDKVIHLERELNSHRNQILSIQHLLEVQMDQKNDEIRRIQMEKEAEEDLEKKMIEMYDSFLYTVLPAIIVVVLAMFFALYKDSRYPIYFHENRTLIMDRSS